MICPSLHEQYYTILAVSFVSALGCIGTIIYFVKYGKRKTYSMRLGLYVVILDLFRSASFMIPCSFINNYPLIVATAFMGHATGVISWIWTAAIAQILYTIVMNSQDQYSKHERYWNLLSILLISIQVVSLFFPVFGCAGTVCTFKLNASGEYWRLLGIYLPQWILIGYTLYCYFRTYSEINYFPLSTNHKTAIKRLFTFSFLQFVTYIPLSVVRVIQYFSDDCSIVIIYIIAFSLYALHGLLSSFTFFWAFNINCKESIKITSTSYQQSNFTSSEDNLLFDPVD
ncbi:hypothetical protein SteCoe_36530 [Stentor coeruleus]|uniref:G-protein coupled receptors family 2 profile 2 domain-containing protein n=1 Tax=Stentor coeruleus TaxID=5963 RepID=A0A1R2AQ56_9CILI|nr:hypothetical protein SteCoe_36530 [Stentor coeruleus]